MTGKPFSSVQINISKNAFWFLSLALNRCVICMMDFVYGDPIRFLPCMHIYHLDCIDDWLMRSFTCPSCMEPVDAALLSSYETNWAGVSSSDFKWTIVFGGFDLLSLSPKSQGLGIKIMHKSFLEIPEWLQMLGKSTWYFRNLGGKVGWYFYVKPWPSV